MNNFYLSIASYLLILGINYHTLFVKSQKELNFQSALSPIFFPFWVFGLAMRKKSLLIIEIIVLIFIWLIIKTFAYFRCIKNSSENNLVSIFLSFPISFLIFFKYDLFGTIINYSQIEYRNIIISSVIFIIINLIMLYIYSRKFVVNKFYRIIYLTCLVLFFIFLIAYMFYLIENINSFNFINNVSF